MPIISSLLLVLALMAAPGGRGGAGAQERLVERIGSAEVPVYEDNLDAAKSRAIAGAQHNAIKRLLGDLLAEEWLTLFQAELRRKIVLRPSRYIGSYRIRRLEASLDRTRYKASLAAQINLNQLKSDLHAFPLPLRGEPQSSVILLYDGRDPALTQKLLRAEVILALKKRLALLNFDLDGTRELSGEEAEILANPFGEPGPRRELLTRLKSTAAIFLSFRLGPKAGEAPAEKRPSATAHIYRTGSGELLGTFLVQLRGSSARLPAGGQKLREAVLTKLVSPLVRRLQPGGIKSVKQGSGPAEPLSVRIVGFASIEEEESFQQAFFRRDSPFANFALHGVRRDDVTYQGDFSGDRLALERELPGKLYGSLRISQVFWYGDLLELEVEKIGGGLHAELSLFPPEMHSSQVSGNYQRFLYEFPDLEVQPPARAEVEDNGRLSLANIIPFGEVAYGYIDARSDTDFFVGEELKEKEEVTISWYRMGRTNLSPVVRLYDETGGLKKVYYPKNYLQVKYKLPKGEHSFHLQVGDRFGSLPWDSGGYLSFRYLFTVERSGTD